MKNNSIKLKSPDQIKRIHESGNILADIFRQLSGTDLTGSSTWVIDTFIDDFIQKRRARAAFKTVRDYNYASCISLNNEVIHGIPSKKRIIQNADIVKIDIGIVLNGYFSDACVTFKAGKTDNQISRLVETARHALAIGIEAIQPGKRIGDIGYSISNYIDSMDFSIVKELTGHGTGFSLHEPPHIPGYGKQGTGEKLVEGMVFTIEPAVINTGCRVKKDKNGWTIITEDSSWSAQFEHTIAVTGDGPVILTV